MQNCFYVTFVINKGVEITTKSTKYIIIVGLIYFSEVYFLKLDLFLHFFKDWIIENPHYLSSGSLVVSQLVFLIHNADILNGISWFRRILNSISWFRRIQNIWWLSLEPLQELLISFIGLKGIKNISLLAQESIDLAVRWGGRSVWVDHCSCLFAK